MTRGDITKIFIDASFFVGEARETDPHHLETLLLIDRLSPAYRLFTSNLVIAETLTILSIRTSRHSSVKFGEKIFENIRQGGILEVFIDEPREQLAWQIFRLITNKDVSFVDCSILQTMKEFNVNTLLTFDTHFTQFQKEFRFNVNRPDGF